MPPGPEVATTTNGEASTYARCSSVRWSISLVIDDGTGES